MSNLFETVKTKTGMSGNQIAKLMGVSPELTSRWNTKKSDPNGLHTLELAKMAGLDIDEALKLTKKEKGAVTLNLVSAITASALACWAFVSDMLYIMLNSKTKSKA